MAEFTPTQGRYLAFIHAYIQRHRFPPAEIDIANAMCVSPPSAHLMVKALEKKGLVLRHPGQPRSLQVLVPEDEIPSWRSDGTSTPKPKSSRARPVEHAETTVAPPATLYVLGVFIQSGPLGKKYEGKELSREIAIRGDQTLDDLHRAIFEAFDRHDEHLYEFQFGKGPFDPDGPRYGIDLPEPSIPQTKSKSKKSAKTAPIAGDARTTRLDDLALKLERVFGYWFDFGDDWFHQVQVDRIEQAIPTVPYPRVIKRVGKSPPQYSDEG